MNKKITNSLLYVRSIIQWSIWWVITTTNIVLLIFISFVIPEKYWNSLVKYSCKIMTFSALIFPITKGYDLKKLPFPVIYVANHVSFFDLFISGSVLPGYPRGIELYKHFFMPIYGWFIARFGQISLEAGNKASLKNALLIAQKKLKCMERNIYIAPEGTRTKNGSIGELRNIAFYLSKKSKVPIVPIVYKNLFNRNNKNSIIINPGFFEVIFLPPVYPEKFSSEFEMKKYVKDNMDKALG